jgi:transposase
VNALFAWRRILHNRRVFALEKQEHITIAHMFAIDLAKRSFEICITTVSGAVLVNQTVLINKILQE